MYLSLHLKIQSNKPIYLRQWRDIGGECCALNSKSTTLQKTVFRFHLFYFVSFSSNLTFRSPRHKGIKYWGNHCIFMAEETTFRLRAGMEGFCLPTDGVQRKAASKEVWRVHPEQRGAAGRHSCRAGHALHPDAKSKPGLLPLSPSVGHLLWPAAERWYLGSRP